MKPGQAVTGGVETMVRLTSTERDTPPPVPLMVRVEEPSDVELLVVTFNVAELVAGLGVNVPDAPNGRPVTVKLTGSANPPDGVMETE